MPRTSLVTVVWAAVRRRRVSGAGVDGVAGVVVVAGAGWAVVVAAVEGDSDMRIAIASGKGGTGKTTVATNLAVVGAELKRRVAYVDCDVEEPNGHLFLQPELLDRVPVSLLVPRVLEDTCDHCGQCSQVCMFSALVWLGRKPLVFEELCHGCGACVRACPRHAILEQPREVGVVETGHAGGVEFVQGRLEVGEAKSPPVIRAVRGAVSGVAWEIIDAPPGTSCPVVAALRGCDLVVLVAEPTRFGLHDLELVVAAVRQLGLPFGVVVNRVGIGDERVERYCEEEAIPVLARIPDDRRVAEAYSRGALMVEVVPGMRSLLAGLWRRLEESVLRPAVAGGPVLMDGQA
jgi:MinD superfamily P-loop ATPase